MESGVVEGCEVVIGDDVWLVRLVELVEFV